MKLLNDSMLILFDRYEYLIKSSFPIGIFILDLNSIHETNCLINASYSINLAFVGLTKAFTSSLTKLHVVIKYDFNSLTDCILFSYSTAIPIPAPAPAKDASIPKVLLLLKPEKTEIPVKIAPIAAFFFSALSLAIA